MTEKEINKKSKSKKLTDAICRDLRRLDKPYFKSGDYPGLQFWIYPTGKKTWRYQYRVKGKKYQERKRLGNYPGVGVVEAIKRAKIEADKIFKGEDPKEQIKSDLLKMQLGDAIRKYYQEELTTINQYSPSTIKGVKATFGPWLDIYGPRLAVRIIAILAYGTRVVVALAKLHCHCGMGGMGGMCGMGM